VQRVKRNDTVKVISGKDAGRTGRVVRVYPSAGRVMVEGVNRVTKHAKTRMTRSGREGGISQIEAPVHASNVMPIDPSCGQPTRTGTRVVDGARVRYCKRCDSEF